MAEKGTVEALIEVAKKEVGTIEGPKDNETKYGKFTKANFQPWCGSFVMWCANQAGVKVPNTVYTPAGENQGSVTLSVYTHRPAISPFSGIQRYTLLYLSNWYFQPESATTYDEERDSVDNHVVIFVVAAESVSLTTSVCAGEMKATQSLRALTTLSIMYC